MQEPADIMIILISCSLVYSPGNYEDKTWNLEDKSGFWKCDRLPDASVWIPWISKLTLSGCPSWPDGQTCSFLMEILLQYHFLFPLETRRIHYSWQVVVYLTAIWKSHSLTLRSRRNSYNGFPKISHCISRCWLCPINYLYVIAFGFLNNQLPSSCDSTC